MINEGIKKDERRVGKKRCHPEWRPCPLLAEKDGVSKKNWASH